MKTIHEHIKEKETKINALLNECGVFWAFSNQQFIEGMKENPIPEGEKYRKLGGGGYYPAKNADKLFTGTKEIEDKFYSDLTPEQMIQYVEYELHNHECFYTGDLEPVYDLFDGRFTKSFIVSVYQQKYQ